MPTAHTRQAPCALRFDAQCSLFGSLALPLNFHVACCIGRKRGTRGLCWGLLGRRPAATRSGGKAAGSPGAAGHLSVGPRAHTFFCYVPACRPRWAALHGFGGGAQARPFDEAYTLVVSMQPAAPTHRRLRRASKHICYCHGSVRLLACTQPACNLVWGWHCSCAGGAVAQRRPNAALAHPRSHAPCMYHASPIPSNLCPCMR